MIVFNQTQSRGSTAARQQYISAVYITRRLSGTPDNESYRAISASIVGFFSRAS